MVFHFSSFVYSQGKPASFRLSQIRVQTEFKQVIDLSLGEKEGIQCCVVLRGKRVERIADHTPLQQFGLERTLVIYVQPHQDTRLPKVQTTNETGEM